MCNTAQHGEHYRESSQHFTEMTSLPLSE